MRKILTCFVFAFASLAALARETKEDLGIRQQDDATMKWFMDAKFGMFLHWGIYAVAAKGEWYMENAAVPIQEYRHFAYDQGDGVFFDAKDFHPDAWAQLARDAGMKYMCLTARHHDGFALFDSQFTNAFTSVQTLHRDLYAEYVKACRAAGLRVGLYYSPINWRYPGYYDVSGTNCVPNAWGYKTESWHRQNAAVMKNEVYEHVRTLFKNYGPFDYVFWDGGWLGQRGNDRDAAYFWEPGKYRDPNNAWKVADEFSDFDETGKPLGLMGIARKYSPQVICNNRSGWIGDFGINEGGHAVKGPVRKEYWEKCLNLNQGSWGYNTNQNLLTYEQIVRYLVDVCVRNGNLLLNLGPDRHGKIPNSHAALIRRVGSWLNLVGDSIYGTRGGPWDPVDGQYGFTHKPGKYFIHLLPGYPGTEITTPPIPEKVTGCFDLFSRRPLDYVQRADGAVRITGLDRNLHNADTALSVVTDGSSPATPLR